MFLIVVGAALASGGFLASLAVFVTYALGMGVVLLGVSIATALGRGAVVRWFKRAVAYVDLVSGVGLLGAGAYLVYREVAFLRFTGWF